MEWWKDPRRGVMWAVGQSFIGTGIDGQINGWMLEGLFASEREAVEHCTCDDYFVCPIPVGIMTSQECPDGMYWPRLQSKENGLERLILHRRGVLLRDNEEDGSIC